MQGVNEVQEVVMSRLARVSCWVFSAAALVSGCGEPGATECTDPVVIGALEIGFRGADDVFVPAVDGQAVQVTVGPQGNNMIVPSLRTDQLDPRGPVPDVNLFLDGVLIAAAPTRGAPVDMTPDGDTFSLDNLGVEFQIHPCCFSCKEVVLTARLVDRNCHACTVQMTVELQTFESCPSERPCCYDSLECVKPEWANLCTAE